MWEDELLAGLDIGTHQTTVVVGEKLPDSGGVRVLGSYTRRTIGMRKGRVIDLDQVRHGIQEAVKKIEDAEKVFIGKVHLATSGGCINSETAATRTVVQSKDLVVTDEDIREVKELAAQYAVKEDRKIIHRIPQLFTLDDQAGIAKPEGMHGRHLGHTMLIVHGRQSHFENMKQVINDAQLDLCGSVFSGICAAKAVLSPEQKRNGVLLVNLGAGVTDIVCYNGGVPVLAMSVPIGGDHVTNDIAYAFRLQTAKAEELKLAEGSAELVPELYPRRVEIQQSHGFDPVAVNIRMLHTVMNARLAELFQLIRDELKARELLPRLADGIVLTGGGAYTPRLAELATRVFGLPCSTGTLHNVAGLDGGATPAAFATAAGLLVHAADAHGDDGDDADGGFLKKLKKMLGH